MQEKLTNALFTPFSNNPKAFLNKTIPDFYLLHKNPRLLVSFSTSKKDSKEFLQILKNSSFYEEKPKKNQKKELEALSKFSIKEVFFKNFMYLLSKNS